MNAYVFVQDVPASWAHYEPLAAALGDAVPEGLILHVAGPTDEGFRIIEVWETREGWERFRSDRLCVAGPARVWASPTVRELRVVNTVRGGWPAS